jgi:hypothetical protein
VERENFENAVDAFMQRQPFQPFAIELVSGRLLEVDSPRALVTRDGVAVHIAPGGVPAIFDYRGVNRIHGELADTLEREK